MSILVGPLGHHDFRSRLIQPILNLHRSQWFDLPNRWASARSKSQYRLYDGDFGTQYLFLSQYRTKYQLQRQPLHGLGDIENQIIPHHIVGTLYRNHSVHHISWGMRTHLGQYPNHKSSVLHHHSCSSSPLLSKYNSYS
eukprot:TRINITY_DN96597_c0_g1_i1.p1 TRINITY_DN96597_c0_g1~~TRINITY_DN96597_c0_g1_i1.p1  ORF type:complete len:139 (+),score=8.73 TRINITY_DN96597_c0_g1_i1:263-679(+)